MRRHIHKLEKVKVGKNKTEFFKCRIPDCPFHILAPLAEGRKSICWSCGNSFTLDKDKMRRRRPNCGDCIILKPRGGKKKDVVAEPITNPLDRMDIDRLLENL